MKGDAQGFFYPDNVDSKEPQEIAAWAFRQFMAVSAAFEAAITRRIEVQTSAPKKPRTGDTYVADGIGWNPGGGPGVYTYYGNQWNKLG